MFLAERLPIMVDHSVLRGQIWPREQDNTNPRTQGGKQSRTHIKPTPTCSTSPIAGFCTTFVVRYPLLFFFLLCISFLHEKKMYRTGNRRFRCFLVRRDEHLRTLSVGCGGSPRESYENWKSSTIEPFIPWRNLWISCERTDQPDFSLQVK